MIDNDGPSVMTVALRSALRNIVAFVVLSLISAPASAAEQVKIGIGYGLAFLPIYICQDQKLIEKYAKAAHLDVSASYERFGGAGPVQDALAARAIDIAPFGLAPLLLAWDGEKNKDAQRQIFAVSGLTTLPLTLLDNRPNVHSISDLRPADRIAMPTSSAPQMYVLQMQAEKIFGDYQRFKDQVVELSPTDALTALFGGTDTAPAYFASPPYTEIALKDPHVHQILGSEQVIDGKASFLILGATKAYIEAHPKIPQVIDQAMDEAARIIRDDPRRAARIYLTHEPSKALDAADIAAVLTANKDEFGSAVEGIGTFADFMGRHGELKTPPQSWKEIVAPALFSSPST
jgi:NitT/TauT family transport system substrate-binding protein